MAARRPIKIRREGNHIRERLLDPRALRRAGLTAFRTKVQGDHRLILAYDPRVRRRTGRTVLQAILHPLSEGMAGRRKKFVCHNDVCRRITEEGEKP